MIRVSIIIALLLIMELVYFRIAGRFGIIDKPNERSSHSRVTLRGGGIIIIMAAFLWILFYQPHYPWFILGLGIISVVSFLDDVRSLPNSVRLVTQFVSMGLLLFQLLLIRSRLTDGSIPLDSWSWALMSLTALVVGVGILNAYNFMDGINGITGGYSIAVLLPIYYLNHQHQELLGLASPFVAPSFIIVMVVACAVFCFFNFRTKALCFAGDVGSVSMAFVIVFVLGRLISMTGDVTYLLFLVMYGVDVILTICHRIMLHENLGEAHRKHAFQLMANELGMSHLQVSSIYMLLQFAISCGLIFLPINHWVYAISVLLLLGVAYILFMRKYYHLHEEYLASLKNKE